MQSNNRIIVAGLVALLAIGFIERLRADETTAAPSGFVDLFDGQSLKGWDGDSRFWRVKDGAIVGETTAETNPKQNTFLIHRGGEFDDFELRLSYQVEGYNSGVQYRSVDRGNHVVHGYQCDFEAPWHRPKGQPNAAGTDQFSGMFFDEGGRMFLAQRGEAVIVRNNPKNAKKPLIEQIGSVGDPMELQKHIRRDDWNELTVIAKGNQFLHMINGHVMAIGIDEDASNRRDSGLFAFQLHKGPPMKIRLKDIRVRRLSHSTDENQVPSVEHPIINAAKGLTRNNREYEQYALRNQGDPVNGKKLFADQRTKCNVCHQVAGAGGDVGKDLSTVGGKFDRPHLIESLLEPSRQIVEGYHTTNALTHEGKVLSGIVKSQNDQQITLADSNGKLQTIRRADIDELSVSAVSLMPEGLARELSLDEFTDLVAYLETLGRANAKRGGGVGGAMSLPSSFEIQTVATELDGLTALDILPDGRVLVCEQPGRVRVIEKGKLLEEPFVSLPVDSYWERGVIGVTHDPGFPEKPYIYVCWVAKNPHPHHRISRFTMKGNVALQGSEKLLLAGDDQTQMGGKVPAGHQGGAMHFGPDGKLYVAIGEQTAGSPSQKLDTFLGKILRINPDGSIPDNNPFVDQTTGKYRAIWARGCRNPFTFAFRKPDGLMLINDVGGRFEEINVGRAGANYGWPVVEHGPENAYKSQDYDGPIHWYRESSLNGGDFCAADSSWPVQWRGKYFFADFQHGWIKTVDPTDGEKAAPFAAGIRQPVDLRFAPDGSLYVLCRNAWVIDAKFKGDSGTVLRIHHTERSAENLEQSTKRVDNRSPASSPSKRMSPSQTPQLPSAGKVVLTKDAIDESAGGLPSFKIETETATYFLEKSGGGLCSLIDRDGNDWLGFHPKNGSRAGGEYRGFPNAVYKQSGSFFHAMNAHVDSMTTRVERETDGYVSIVAESDDTKWQGRYEFFATHCMFSITKMPADKRYWILYEGTPGGNLEMNDWWMTSAITKPQPVSRQHNGDIPSPEWIAFGDNDATRSLVLLNHEDDQHPDCFYQMNEQMTVFGFGRQRLESYHSKVGQKFSIGLIENTSHGAISRFVDEMLRSKSPTASHSKINAASQPLSIDVWYGSRQNFGQHGNPQKWVNVLGRVGGHSSSTSLQYSLNGGPRRPLAIGPNYTRLANAGDFNVEIDRADLKLGDNTLILSAKDKQQNATSKVIVHYSNADPPALPLHIDWSKVKKIHDVAEVTDGRWKLAPGGVRIVEPYYDRVLAFGDASWTDYEVTVPVTFHGFRQPGPNDGGRNVVHAAIAVRWPGHHDGSQAVQPRTKWYPLGATAEFMINKYPTECRWRILGGGGKVAYEQSPRKIEFDKRYVMKHRVESTGEQDTTYRVKLWDADQTEPDHWDVTTLEKNDVPAGGALILAHYSDVTFGNVTVRSLSK